MRQPKGSIEVGNADLDYWWTIHVERLEVTITGDLTQYSSRASAVRSARRVAKYFGITITSVWNIDDPEQD